MKKKPYAIYFPQFYPSKVNDEAWGKHFTDWLLVGQANFQKLWDRRAPARGFYDGSDVRIHQDQVSQAQASGLAGFGVYHYWFYTQHELSAFEESILSNQVLNEADSWFLIWANESWSKRWVGNADVLIDLSRNPSLEMIEKHCKHLARCFQTPGYVKWRERPLFVFYNLGYFDHPEQVVINYRQCLASLGCDAAMIQIIKNAADIQYSRFMDGSYLFEPRMFFNSVGKARGSMSSSILAVIRRVFGTKFTERLLVRADKFLSTGKKYAADDFATYFWSLSRQASVKQLSGSTQNILCPAWNNAPRYGQNFTSLEPISPHEFLKQLEASNQASDLPLLINAWNEWSEGAAIEPCAYYGNRYLDVIKQYGETGV